MIPGSAASLLIGTTAAQTSTAANTVAAAQHRSDSLMRPIADSMVTASAVVATSADGEGAPGFLDLLLVLFVPWW